MLGAAIFVVLFAIGAVLIALDGPLAWVGRVIQRLRNRLRRSAEPLRHLPERLLRERGRIVGVLGPRWKRALVAVGRALGVRLRDPLRGARRDRLPAPARPRAPRLLRRAGADADPHHPGRARVRGGGPDRDAHAGRGLPGDAVLATFAYRLFSYWLPLPVGLAAYGWYQRLVRRPAAPTPPPG